MKNFFHDMLGEAQRLTQGGQLQAATDMIQQALREAGAASMPGPARPDTGATASHRDDQTIDVESRVIDGPSEPADVGAEQWLSGHFTHQGRTLDYKLYVPPRAAGAAATPRPLLLMLHGCTQSPDDFAAGTRMNSLAREAGMLVLYPEQTQHANAQKCWNWFKTQHQQRGRGEPALLAALTRKTMAEHGVDASRVYVAGLSAGGAMADIMGRCEPQLFAAVGVHSGLPAGAAANLPAALAAMRSGAASSQASAAVCPVIVFHGDADGTVHHANGQAIVDAGRRAQPIVGAPQVRGGQAPNGQRFTQTVHRAADGSSAIEHWQLHGAGHAWSGGSAAGSYTAPGGVDASAEMLRFFQSHQRPPAA